MKRVLSTIFLFVVLLQCNGVLLAQPRQLGDSEIVPQAKLDPPIVKPEKKVDWGRIGITAGTLGIAMFSLHEYQMHSWWNGQRQGFHVQDDPGYKANFDKFGHTFGAYYTSHFYREAYNWSGMDSTTALALAAFSGFLWEFYVEIEDGFARDWGFSPGDARADLMGASFFYLRNQVPFLRNFEYKWSYWPSNQLLNNNPDIPGQTLNITDDYGGQEYWISAKMHNLLPDSWQGYWPKWLNLAVGFSGWNLDARDAKGNEDYGPRRKAYWLALDYDVTAIWPESEYEILNFIRRGLDYWHLPAPAVRIYPEPRFYILFPLRMSIG